VIGIEVDPGLADRARANLAERANVEILTADGSRQEPGPVDAIIVNAGATHPAPGWLAALMPGGRMLLPLTTERDDGIMLRIERLGAGRSYAAECVSAVHIYPCSGARERGAERALVRALAGGGQRFIRSLRIDRHAPGRTCWLHGDRFCLSIDPPAALKRAHAREARPSGSTNLVGRSAAGASQLPGPVRATRARSEAEACLYFCPCGGAASAAGWGKASTSLV
jgi:predicted RNA-binding protein YlxR (DUF448 family)